MNSNRPIPATLLVMSWSLLVLLSGCERKPAESGSAGTVRVASLVPAATDLIIGMGAADQLVAVSNYDVEREGTRGKPRVGDYQNVDWERLRALKVNVLIIFQSADRVPPGMKQKSAELGVELVNVRTETLDDLFLEMKHLGQVLKVEQAANRAGEALRRQLDEVRRRIAGQPRVRTLIVRDAQAEQVVGRGNFLNDLLEIAGGENVVTAEGWPTIDRELLRSYRAEVILQLLSEAPPHVEREARRVWETLGDIPAVRNHRVVVINAWYTQQPGYQVGVLAERFAQALHGEVATTRGEP